MSVVDESGRPFNVNLTNCAREPIHVPGHVQPFGALIAIKPDTYVVEQASANARERFGREAEELIGMTVDDVLGAEISAALRSIIGREEVEGNPVPFFTGEVVVGRPVRLIVHSFREMLIVEAEAIKATASGLLAIRVTKVPGEYVMWFRPEQLTLVEWAGNPDKPVTPGPNGDRLSPRKSFEAWQQEVRLKSEPWSEAEIDAARRLRLAITEVVIRRAEEVSRANLRLERSNVELDSFAYIASHDLKEPLRGIHNYANFLLEDYGELLDRPGQERLQSLVRLAERMENLTDSLLHYSRLGRQELNLREVDLNKVLGETIEATHARLVENGTEVRIPWPLPTARCDAVQMGEVFQNLIANSAKYNNKPERWVEIGFQRGGTLPSEQPFVLYVKDNGIGILPKHFDTIFRIFKRLHGRNDFGGGSGAGLTIAQKIVQRHGGRLWLESVPDEGTTFYITLGA